MEDPLECHGLVMRHLEQHSGIIIVTLYASRYWFYHLSKSSLGDKAVKQGLKEFFRDYVIPWRIVMEMKIEIQEQDDKEKEEHSDVQSEQRAWQPAPQSMWQLIQRTLETLK
jgi:hypothetical protein